jgi:TolA-binding protein
MLRRLAAGAVALALAATGTATRAAGEPRGGGREADLGEKRSVAPDAALGGTLEAKKPAKKEPGGPALAFEQFRKAVEVQVSDKRREEISSLRRLIELGGGSDDETPKWYFRLAELLWEESQYFFFEANRRDDRLIALGTRGDPKEIDRLMAEKRDLEGQQKKLRDQSVALYGAIIKRYPKYPRLDEVLYFLAENLSKRNRTDADAIKAYGALIQRFPKSRFVPDAWMAVGEYWFEKSTGDARTANLRKALGAYQKAAEYQESSVYGYALYKQGWVYNNLAEWTQALDMFRAVIFFGELPTATVPADRKLALVKEARKDYVRTYSHVGSAEGAADEFKRVGGEGGWVEMLKTLAGIFYEEGKDRDAIVVYRRLIQEKPTSPETAFFQSRIVTCAGRMGKKEATVQQAHVFVKMLRELEAAPGPKDDKTLKALQDARKDAEVTLRVLAVQYHNEWKKTRDEPVAGYAAAVYRDYLDVFPDEAASYELRFFHAELLYALADFPAAGEEYERVGLHDVKALEAKPPAKPGKFFKDALENAVFAWDVVAKRLDDEKKGAPAPADPKKRSALAPQRQRLLDACLRYLKWQPKGDKYVEIAYKAARLYYQHNAFAEATDLFTRIALDHPGHELAGYSTNLVLDAYNLLGDWRNVNGWAKRFYANAKLLEAHPALKPDLAKIIEESAFKVIEEKERAKDYEGAAEEYLAFARDWPQSRLAATALFNASVDYVKVRRIDKAVEVRNLVLQRYPDHELAPAALYDNAEAYEAIAEFEKAAELYERYFASWRAAQHKGAPAKVAKAAKGKAKKGKGKSAEPAPEAAPRSAGAYDERKATDGIINAAVFRAGLRQWAKAEAASRAYLDAFPDGPDAPRIFLSIADLQAKQGQTAKQLKQLEDYQRKYAKDPDEWLGLQAQLAQLYERSGNPVMARRVQAQGLEYWRRNKDKVKERGLALVARAMYEELDPAFTEYDRITLNVAPKYLKAQLEVKAKKLRKLEEAYGQVVHLKQAEPAVCGLYKIGLAYKRFAQALYDTPIPKEIRGDRSLVDEYKSLLAQQAEPLEAKAVDGLALAVNAARDYGVSNECAKQATVILVKHKPDEYGPSPEVLPPITAPAPVEAPRGYGLLAEVEGVPLRAPAARRDGPALPPLRVRTAGGREDRGPADEPRDELDPQRRVIRDEPVPVKKKAPRKKAGATEEDEDLLP